jgi:hypothetical protein
MSMYEYSIIELMKTVKMGESLVRKKSSRRHYPNQSPMHAYMVEIPQWDTALCMVNLHYSLKVESTHKCLVIDSKYSVKLSTDPLFISLKVLFK